MADTKKTVIVTKVYDHDCDVCSQMSRHDRATFESFPEVGYQEVTLDEVIKPADTARPLTYHVIYQCLEKYCLTPTYEIDLPVYVFLSKKGDYLGHLQGANTITEIREGVKSLSSTTDNSSE